jgi:ferritin
MFKVTLLTLVVLAGSLNAQKSHAKQNFGCNAILNDQIKKEFEASHTYLSLANHFAHDSQALHGFSKMFYNSWKEELSHGEHLMDYVIRRGGTPCTPIVEVSLKTKIKVKKY